MNKFRQFMYGRYGYDQLSVFLTMLYVFLYLIALLYNLYWLEGLIFLGSLSILCRTFSKNLSTRNDENQTFQHYAIQWKYVYSSLIIRVKDREHKYVKCPACRILLQVPKGRGNVMIKCTKCGCRFKGKS